jgi:hypothetical protein
LPTQIGFFKVDVNGAEPFVVYGARDTIKRNLPVVVVELDKDRSAAFKKDWAKHHEVRRWRWRWRWRRLEAAVLLAGRAASRSSLQRLVLGPGGRAARSVDSWGASWGKRFGSPPLAALLPAVTATVLKGRPPWS